MWETDGLKQILVVKTVSSVLWNAIAKGNLNKISQWQDVDTRALKAEIIKVIENKEAEDEEEATVQVLEEQYPSLYLFICWRFGEKKKFAKYMQACDILGYGLEKTFSKYIQGYWMPWLNMQR